MFGGYSVGIWLILLILVLLILVALLILVMASTITIRVHLILRSKEYRMIVRIRMLYGLVNARIEVPIMLNDNGIEYTVKYFSKQSEGTSQDLMENSKFQKLRFNDYRHLFQATDGFKDWFLNTMSNVRLSEIRWSTSLALDNAAETAVAAGTVWGVKHTILGWLSFHLRMKSTPELHVLPEFNGPPQLSTDFSCVARISCGRAIIAGLKLVIRVLKIKGGLKIWQNTLFKA